MDDFSRPFHVPCCRPEGEPPFNGSVENLNGWFQEPLFGRRFPWPGDRPLTP